MLARFKVSTTAFSEHTVNVIGVFNRSSKPVSHVIVPKSITNFTKKMIGNICVICCLKLHSGVEQIDS